MIVITTPTGLIGHQVLDNLLDSAEELRVIARDPSALPADVRGRLDIVEGSHRESAVVDQAFAGADAVFWLTPPDPRAPSVEAAFVGFTRRGRGVQSGGRQARRGHLRARPRHALG